MNELTKTIAFVAAAAAIALVAVASHFMNQPTNAADFELVGQPFFEEFTSASQAQNLEVAAVDPETGRLKRFSVQNKDGLWTIPSHYDYPAEAAARLANTATSVMGIQRDSLAGRLANEHERLGVVDPLDDDIEDPESAGKRITMKDASGEIVVDYIIGKIVDQEVVLSRTDRPFGNDPNERYYYVRRPDEQQTYKVKLDIDLSTKFSDWIDPDLLRLERSELTRIKIDNYSIEEDRSAIPGQVSALLKQQGDVINVSRKSSTDAWELEGLKPETEELDNARVSEVISVLEQMQIAGVRPKFKYKDQLLLTADLKLNRRPEFEANPQEFGQAIMRLQDELDEKGFNLAGNSQKMELVSKHGELELGTDKGIAYTLHIGETVEGDDEAIEIGTASGSETESEGSSDESTADQTKDSSQSPAEESPADVKNRYLMVRVSFDESLIGPKPEKPVEPVEPVAPEGYQPPAETETETETGPDEVAAPADVQKPGESTGEEAAKQDVAPTRNPEFAKYDEAKKQFEQQKVEFELAKTRFEDESRQYEERTAEGKRLVDELNQRFGDWYYVISADNLKTLQSDRADLITVKQPPAAKPEIMQPRPDISFPGLPGAPGVNPDQNQPGIPQEQPESNPSAAGKGDNADPTGSSNPPMPEQESGSDAPTDPTNSEPAKSEPPKTEPPKTEPPKTEPPKTEPPKTEPPKTEPATANTPKTDGPKTDGSNSDASSKTNAPETDAVKSDASKTNAAKSAPPADAS